MIASSARLRAVLLAMLVAAAVLPVAHGSEEDHVLVLGRISDDPNAHYRQLKPLLDYVVPRMADVGIREGRILMARDRKQMDSYLRRGRVDWVTETAASGMQLQMGAGAEPLLVTERSGVSRYRTVFFARTDSGIASLEDLKGRSVAFQNPNSTSAYYMPALTLIERGLPMEILLSPRDRPVADSVGYLFARSELNISTWVHKRLVDAGAMSNLDWRSPQRVPDLYRRDMMVFHETPEYPRALEMVRGDLAPAIKARLREVLIAAADDPDASEAMLRFFKTTRFLPLKEEDERSLALVRAGVKRVGSEIE
ncbi:phosphate/phosphite/phosphonate ABC transporter substrate-binding protein [Luteimonas vadosa]|uniref:Phosphate/phosphite/phosphonate ABC transporter substrate-binding protein n=2 Tax=Luteimonas vadosa TaxID=1165507 RepID=A0ABP9E9E2_9GAMM